MLSIRKTKTSSGKIAVQVVHYEKRKVVVDTHIGSADTKEELAYLLDRARLWAHAHQKQATLFPPQPRRLLQLDTVRFVKTTHQFAYRVLTEVITTMGFSTLPKLLTDFALIRLIEPASKLRSIELLKHYFEIAYTEITLYRTLQKLPTHKDTVEKCATVVATTTLKMSLSLVLYDVTTLYFETLKEDDALRKRGFSKDRKEGQPQIVVGLLVTNEGFPVGYEVFPGNTFEGKTMLPMLKDFAKKHGVETPMVVADAAMISLDNVKALNDEGYSYIVGGRLANCSAAIIRDIEKAPTEDGSLMRLTTERGELICAFSELRYRKDKHEMDKQWEKAENVVAAGAAGKKVKFVTRSVKEKFELNNTLKKKATTLLGWKGYYTNIEEQKISSKDVIVQYHMLWKVEQAFRMAKSDLETRPIFHYKADSVRAHMLICFVSLCVGKYLETVTSLPLRSIRDIILSVADATVVDTTTGEQFILRSEPSEKVKQLLDILGMSY